MSKRGRVWTCFWSYYDTTSELKSSILCRSRDKLYAKVFSRFVGGQLQCGFGPQTLGRKLGGTWSSRDGVDIYDPRWCLSRKTLERRVKYGGKKGRAAKRRLQRR